MRNNKKQKKTMLLLLILLSISIGFALLSTTLKINGTASVKSNTWDIHWERVVPNPQSTVQAATPTITENGTKVTYEVELALPGDFYEFTVDAKNDGSVNGKIDEIRHTVKEVTIVGGEEVETTATLPNYIHATIYYNGTTIAPDEGDILEAGKKKRYRVRIEYDSLSEVLPESDKVYRITDEIDYVQTKEEAPVDFNTLLAEIKDDPDSYRNPDQDPTNLDIGVDKNGNIVNLDWWVDQDQCSGEKIYSIDTTTNEALIGGKDGNGGCKNVDAFYYTAATSAANIENGKWQLTIPQYIYDNATSEFYPVTELGFVFTYTGAGTTLTEMPDLPDTLETIGESTFIGHNFTSVTIPKNIKRIKSQAFENAFASNGSNNTLTFETGSQLERIDDAINGGVFAFDNLKGNIIFPQTVTYIGKAAFENGNDLTSVTFPSTATYFENEEFSWDNSFDVNVTINHNY